MSQEKRCSGMVGLGVLAVGVIIGISSFGNVRAEIISNASKIFRCSSGRACVEGSSTGSKTSGVYGASAKDDGVRGKSSSGYGVDGTGLASGVHGYSSSGSGVDAESDSTYNPALAVSGDNPNTELFLAANVSTGYNVCEIDAKANLNCTGTIGGSKLRERHRNGSGRSVLSFASQSATATIEDVGTARMYDGVANVQIDRAFASVTDHKWYYVFLTPLGDTRGLYVSEKTPTAFQVRENEHGRSSLTFDYRIVAHPLDSENDRLPPAPEEKIPRPRQQIQQ